VTHFDRGDFNHHPPCFGKKTGRGSPILDPELWINVLQVFAHGGGADSENYTDLGIRLATPGQQ
jgi:hypothetical protein